MEASGETGAESEEEALMFLDSSKAAVTAVMKWDWKKWTTATATALNAVIVLLLEFEVIHWSAKQLGLVNLAVVALLAWFVSTITRGNVAVGE